MSHTATEDIINVKEQTLPQQRWQKIENVVVATPHWFLPVTYCFVLLSLFYYKFKERNNSYYRKYTLLNGHIYTLCYLLDLPRVRSKLPQYLQGCAHNSFQLDTRIMRTILSHFSVVCLKFLIVILRWTIVCGMPVIIWFKAGTHRWEAGYREQLRLNRVILVLKCKKTGLPKQLRLFVSCAYSARYGFMICRM